jgi:ubiquinol-cytochrome c reductase cytochrome c1 subunit
MSLRILPKTLLVILALAIVPANVANAAGAGTPPPEQDWTFDGPFGTYDRAAMQRGLKVYREVCAACHSLKRIYFRNLEDLGYSEAQVKNIAVEYTVIDGPDSEGEMFERPAKPSDAFPSPFPNKQAATAANGAYPPDLSLITKARANGPDYLVGLLTGYKEPSHEYLEHHTVPEGKHYNEYYPGHIITMAAPLSDGMVAYEDETPETVEQYAKDVTHFLAWAAEPELEDRKRLGIQVILFLLVFTGIMYAIKRKVWADVH